MIPKSALKAEDVRAIRLNTMVRHLSLKTEGYRSTTNEMFNLLLKAVAEGSSGESVCADRYGEVDYCPKMTCRLWSSAYFRA